MNDLPREQVADNPDLWDKSGSLEVPLKNFGAQPFILPHV